MKIAICAKESPLYTGGLAAYQRLLAKSLREELGAKVSFVCAKANLDQSMRVEALEAVNSVCIFEEEKKAIWIEDLLPIIARRKWFHNFMTDFSRICWGKWLNSLDELKGCDAIHLVGTGWDFFGFALASFAHNQGVIFTIWPAVHQNSWGDDDIDLRLYNRADRVFCQSRFEAQHLIEKGLDPNKAVIAGLPPMCRDDGDGERLRKKLNLADRPAVLYLGRRDSGKGYPAVLKAWKEVIEVIPDAVLLIAGPRGKEFEALKSQLPESSYRDLGVPDEKTKADAYAACDIFCLPSDHESFGIVYVEAWSYAKPVICGTAPASRELVRDNETGLWASQDPVELALKLIYLLTDENTLRRLGKAGKMLQESSYSERDMIETHFKAWGQECNSSD